ncbi:MAG: type II toxin-antitoxin system RelE/ParE family toxin [Pyrinomonadaceae bacterium MAG19_C2-C3]|nr:type II toxin-antitoxin system RelE/ParE family toxin [Pyrinomonadaceae bacterium MAG19_C2-C3]
MNIFWTDAALAQLEAIRDYYAQTSPDYANRLIENLFARAEQAARFPHSGRAVPEYDLPEVRQLLEGSYRIIYLILEVHIEILAVIHTSRRALNLDE